MKKVTKIEENKRGLMEKPKLKVAAYCRVSTDSDAQLESLEAQKTHYENYINAREDWQFAGLYFDEGITGTKKDKRLELMRMISDCEAGLIDFVITKSISRFARNTTDCLELVRKLLELNIPVYFEKENINTGSMESELFLAILSSMAEGESVSISENSKWSAQKRFQNGTFKISYPPYGYTWNGEEMQIEPSQALVVKRIFKDTLAGLGTAAIAKALNAEGIPTKKGGVWHPSTVRGIIANEKYTGSVLFQKTYTDSNFNRHINNGQHCQYYIEDHHEAIIDRETFEAAAAIISQRGAEKGIQRGLNKYQQRYAFSGKIICGECGDTFKRRIHTCKEHKYVAWCCNTHLEDTSKCSMLYIRDDDLQLAFITMMNKLIYGHRFILKPLIENLKGLSSDRNVQRIKEIQTLLLQNTEQRETLTKLMAQGYIDQILFNKENNELLTQADNYRAEIAMLSRKQTGDASQINEATALLRFTERSSMLTEFDDGLFEKYVERIKVYSRNEVGFELKCGLTLRERM